MEFFELVKKRFSLRNYSDKPVKTEDISKCLEAAKLAPSACNSQPWKFVVIDKPELKEQIAMAAFKSIISINSFAVKAPVLVLIVSERQKMFAKFGSIVKKKNFQLIDVGIAAEHFCLQAAELGLGTCMLGWFNEGKVKNILSIPNSKRIELIISVGYAANQAQPGKKRKPIEEMSSFNSY